MTRHQTYAESLVAELDDIEAAYLDIIGRSATEYVNPNRHDSGIIFVVAAAEYDWSPLRSDARGDE